MYFVKVVGRKDGTIGDKGERVDGNKNQIPGTKAGDHFSYIFQLNDFTALFSNSIRTMIMLYSQRCKEGAAEASFMKSRSALRCAVRGIGEEIIGR